MAKFTTRVELINAVAEDYDTLHKEMEGKNFTRTIKSIDGKEYYLPPAEYNREGEYTTGQTLSAAKAAASVTKKQYRILVTKASERSWFNLEPIKK